MISPWSAALLLPTYFDRNIGHLRHGSRSAPFVVPSGPWKEKGSAGAGSGPLAATAEEGGRRTPGDRNPRRRHRSPRAARRDHPTRGRPLAASPRTRPMQPDPMQRTRRAVTSWKVSCSGRIGSHGQKYHRVWNRARQSLHSKSQVRCVFVHRRNRDHCATGYRQSRQAPGEGRG